MKRVVISESSYKRIAQELGMELDDEPREIDDEMASALKTFLEANGIINPTAEQMADVYMLFKDYAANAQ